MLKQAPLSYGPARHDGTQQSMQLWFKSGWGALRGGALGPTPGNPWSIENDRADAEHPNAMLKT